MKELKYVGPHQKYPIQPNYTVQVLGSVTECWLSICGGFIYPSKYVVYNLFGPRVIEFSNLFAVLCFDPRFPHIIEEITSMTTIGS